MSNCSLYNGQNLDGTGNAYTNPYGLIQNAGKKRRTQRRLKTSKRKRKSRKNKTKCRKGGLIKMAYRYFNIY